MTQIIATEIFIKIYAFQENKSISLFHMENKLWFMGIAFAFDYRLLQLLSYVLVLKVHSNFHATYGGI